MVYSFLCNVDNKRIYFYLMETNETNAIYKYNSTYLYKSYCYILFKYIFINVIHKKIFLQSNTNF